MWWIAAKVCALVKTFLTHSPLLLFLYRTLLCAAELGWELELCCFGFFTPSVELKPSPFLAHTLHITRFGLSSLFSGAAIGLAMATATSGIRHFIRPPLSAANWLCFYKQASSQPANTRWHSLISVSPDRRNTYGGKKGEIRIAIAISAAAFFSFFLKERVIIKQDSDLEALKETRTCRMKTD